ncbi:MAG: peptidase dimerization domain-containing protein, partial [Erysipelotrichaceae bacterium]
DLEYRSKLVNERVLKSKSGKIDMILNHQFDDYDLAIGWHSLVSEKYDFDINTTLAGFVYLEYHFEGKPAHAGVEPQVGINSLDFAVDVYQYMRKLETEYGLDNVRINPKINDDDQLNIVSSETTLKTYVRYIDINIQSEVVKKINDFIAGLAKEKGVVVRENHDAGYFPLIQFKPINNLFVEKTKDNYEMSVDEVLYAGGDLGDLSYLIPTVQFGYNGFKGNIHGNEFKMTDPNFVFIDSVKAFIEVISDVDTNIESYDLYKKTVEEYEAEKFKELL